MAETDKSMPPIMQPMPPRLSNESDADYDKRVKELAAKGAKELLVDKSFDPTVKRVDHKLGVGTAETRVVMPDAPVPPPVPDAPYVGESEPDYKKRMDLQKKIAADAAKK